MGIGRIILEPSGSATAPSALSLILPTQDDYRGANHGPLTWMPLETLRGLLWSNGQDQMRHVVTNVLKTGVLAPEKAPTVSAGSQSDATLNVDVVGVGASPYNPSNGDSIWIGPSRIYFVTTLPSMLLFAGYVVIGGTASVTLDNLRSLIEGTAGQGVTWALSSVLGPLSNYVTVTSKTAYTLAIQSVAYGAQANSIQAYLVNGTWTDSSFGSTGGTVGTIGYMQNGADGAGAAPEAGIYDGWAYNYLRTEDSAQSGLSPRSALTISAAMNVTVAGMVAPDDPDNDVDFIRVWRPIASAYKKQRVMDIDEDDTSEDDDTDNDTLKNRESFDESVYGIYANGYPPRARCVAPYKLRVFAAGARLSAEYSAGTASVTNANNEVTLTGAYPTVEWIGRTFREVGDSLAYPIVRVDSATKKLYLAKDFEGTTDGTASYTVRDLRNPYEVSHAESLLPNAWPGNSFTGVSSTSSEGMMALVPGFGHLIGLTPTGLWRITGDSDDTFSPHHESEIAGTVSPRAALMVEGVLWWLGEDGIYAWAGGGEPMNMTRPPVAGGEVTGIHRTIRRLNQRQLEGVVASYDEEERIVRWAVPLDDDVTNRHVIVLDLTTTTFSTDECEDWTEIATVVDSGGSKHQLAGDVHGNILELNVGESDGAYGFEPVVEVSAATSRTITGTGFPTAGSGLAGIPVYLVGADGAFTREKIASNTSTVLTLTRYTTAPLVKTQIAVGGILYDMETGRWHGGDLRDEKTVSVVTVGFTPQTRGQMWLASAADQDTPALHGDDTEIDLTDASGRAVVAIGQHGYLHKQRFVSVAPNFTPNMHALEFEVQWRDQR